MKTPLRHLSRPRYAALLLGSLLSPWLAAQMAPEAEDKWKDWYQVEVIIFAQSQGEAGEIWRPDLELDYPREWLQLLSPAALAEQLSEAETPELGDDGWQLEGFESGENGERGESGLPDTMASKPAPPSSDPLAVPTMEVEPFAALEDHRSLLLLPPEEWTLRDQARRLSRSSDQRILFHGAWLQPLAENRDEPSILISGGEQYDEHRELEGSIKLYRRTYLHIETDLWLASFAPNFGQEGQPWPALPFPPNRPPELGDFIPIDSAGSSLWQQLNDTSSNDEYAAILASPYVVNKLVTLQQRRRMRSTELHYVDHPLMGLLVVIRPYEGPEDGEAAAGSASL